MIAFLAAVSLLSAPVTADIVTFNAGGLDRQAMIYTPSVKTDHPPLVFGFHGHGGNMRNSSRTFQIHELWPEAVVVYMQGLPTAGMTDPQGKKNGWQKSKGLYDDRDLKFFDAVYDKMLKDFKADPNRVYAMGHSNGGAFTYLLWAERADKFAAFGPSGAVASVYRGSLKPKPAFIVSGERDQLVPPAAQMRGIEYVKSVDGISGDAKMGTLKGSKADLGLYIYPGDHTYPREANKLMVEFFKSHSRK